MKKWNDIKHRGMTPEQITAADERVDEEVTRIRLRELREAAGVTQEEMARRVESAQTHVSRLERREDHRISTLRRYVEALGGKLEIAAILDGKRVPL